MLLYNILVIKLNILGRVWKDILIPHWVYNVQEDGNNITRSVQIHIYITNCFHGNLQFLLSINWNSEFATIERKHDADLPRESYQQLTGSRLSQPGFENSDISNLTGEGELRQ